MEINKLNEENLIEKSRSIATMECLDSLDIQELKLIDIYLSCINPRNPETREVKFSKRQYEQILGLNEVNVERLDEYVSHLMHNEVKIPVKTDRGIKIRKHILFPDALLEKVDKEWYITLEVNPRLDDVFFNIKNLGYIKYRLKYTVKLQSKYDIKLYLFLKTNEYSEPHEVEITLKKLKEKIECNKESYNVYKAFNQFVLKPSIQRINDFTDLSVSYKKPRKKSYEEEKIIFTVSKKSKQLEPKKAVEHEPKVAEPEHEVKAVSAAELIQQPEIIEPKKIDNPYNLPPDVMADTNFDINSLVEKIKNFITDADEQMIKDIFNVATFDYNPKKVNTTPILYYSGIVSNKTKELKEKLKMTAEEEAKSKKPIIKKTSLHNFKERDTDYDAIYAELNRQKYGKN